MHAVVLCKSYTQAAADAESYSKESMNDDYQYGDENKKEDEDEDDDNEEEKDGDEDAIGRPGGRCGDQAELQQGFQGLRAPLASP